MHAQQHRRKKTLVQKQIQGGLACRVVLYWFFCLCSVMLFVAVGTMFSGNLGSAGEIFGGLWKDFSTPILASVLLIPLVIWDVVKTSHRFVGPIFRLENAVKDLADGKPVEPIRFRKNDQWHSLAEQFNRLSEVTAELRKDQVRDSKFSEASPEEFQYETTLG